MPQLGIIHAVVHAYNSRLFCELELLGESDSHKLGLAHAAVNTFQRVSGATSTERRPR
jgi:hypothetical protein